VLLLTRARARSLRHGRICGQVKARSLTFDLILQRFVDGWMSFPDLIILLVVVSVLLFVNTCPDWPQLAPWKGRGKLHIEFAYIFEATTALPRLAGLFGRASLFS